MLRREKEMTLTIERIEELRSWLSAKGLSSNTSKGYCSDLMVFLEATGTPTVTAQEFEDLALAFLTMNRNRVSARTTLRRLTSLRTWTRFGGIQALEEYSGPTPLRSMPHPLPGGIEDVYKLIEVANRPRDKALIAECGLMGMRIFEALKSVPSEYDLREMTCVIRGKRDKQRIVPVSDSAWEFLRMPFMESFVNGGGPIITIKDRAARQRITELGATAGISRPISSHDLRHTFGTHVYQRTNNIRLVQELMGHDSIETTQIYTGVFLSQAREAVDF